MLRGLVKSRISSISEPQIDVLRDQRRTLQDGGSDADDQIRDFELLEGPEEGLFTGLE
jgi:hypothetical protein